jgi:hypothetical protein
MPLTAAYGLRAEDVLEVEAVPAKGQQVIATPPNNHADLFWALNNGDRDNYPTVLSTTSRLMQMRLLLVRFLLQFIAILRPFVTPRRHRRDVSLCEHFRGLITIGAITRINLTISCTN